MKAVLVLRTGALLIVTTGFVSVLDGGLRAAGLESIQPGLFPFMGDATLQVLIGIVLVLGGVGILWKTGMLKAGRFLAMREGRFVVTSPVDRLRKPVFFIVLALSAFAVVDFAYEAMRGTIRSGMVAGLVIALFFLAWTALWLVFRERPGPE